LLPGRRRAQGDDGGRGDSSTAGTAPPHSRGSASVGTRPSPAAQLEAAAAELGEVAVVDSQALAAVTGPSAVAAPALGTQLSEGAAAANPGSLGHPNLCSRPCLYFERGRCANGAACQFCHIPHAGRRAALTARARQHLQRMSRAEAMAAILPILLLKLRAVDPSGDVAGVFDRLVRTSLAHGGAPADVRHTVGLRASGRALENLDLPMLLGAMRRYALGGDGPAVAETFALMECVRSAEVRRRIADAGHELFRC